MTAAPVNGDMSRRVAVDTGSMPWEGSPSGSVFRKRLHRVGPVEAGEVTSLVRFSPDATFSEHEHPEGEEILVLEGTFSDQAGDWGPGSYLLNPHGSSHQPFSHEGCLLWVKLRQYVGEARERLQINTEDLDWIATAEVGIEKKVLYKDSRFADSSCLERWAAGVASALRRFPGGAEIFILEGELADDEGRYRSGWWLRLPPGAVFQPLTEPGCTFYLKAGGVESLRSV